MGSSMKCALLLVMVTLNFSLFLWKGAADSTVTNAAQVTMTVSGYALSSGSSLTVAIDDDQTTSTIDISYTKNITGVQIKNNKEYFVVENLAGTTAILAGQTVKTLDLIEAKNIETGF